MVLKEHSSQVFHTCQNVGIRPKCNLTKFEVSTPSRFEYNADQYQPFSSYFSVAILSVF